jgi:hypothetical protein
VVFPVPLAAAKPSTGIVEKLLVIIYSRKKKNGSLKFKKRVGCATNYFIFSRLFYRASINANAISDT